MLNFLLSEKHPSSPILIERSLPLLAIALNNILKSRENLEDYSIIMRYVSHIFDLVR